MTSIYCILHQLDEYCSGLHRSNDKHQQLKNINIMITELVNSQNLESLVTALVELKKNGEYFSDILDIILQNTQALKSLSHSLCAEMIISLILSDMQNYMNQTRTSSAGFSKILHCEQILCRFLKHFCGNLRDSKLLRPLLTVVEDIARNACIIDCITTAAMIVLMLMKNIYQTEFDKKVFNILSQSCNANSTKCDDDLGNIFLESLDKHSSENVRFSFLYGILSVMQQSTLTFAQEGCSLGKIVFDMLLISDPSEPMAKVLQARCLQIWYRKATEYAPNLSIDCDLFVMFSGAQKNLMAYIFNHQDDAVDSIKHCSRDVFNLSLKCHSVVCPEGTSCSVMRQLFCQLFALSWDQRGKYSLISSVVDHFGCQCVLEVEPRIYDRLVSVSNEHALATHASDLFFKLLSCELSVKSVAGTDSQCWICPIIDGLNSEGILRLSLVQYFIPKLAKIFPAGIQQIIDHYNTIENADANILLTCVRHLGDSRCVPVKEFAQEYWRGIIPLSILRKAFVSADDQVRLDALVLLCESSKITEPVQKSDLCHILDFVGFNLNSQQPSFRNHLRSSLKKLYKRIVESHTAVNNRIKRRKAESGDFNVAENYKDFLQNMLQLLLNRLYPGASFPRRTFVLECLVEHLKYFSASHQDLLSMQPLYSKEACLNILYFLADTFGGNKKNALTILVEVNCIQCLNESTICAIADSAWKMSSSNRPQDCATAVHLFRLLLTLAVETFFKSVIGGTFTTVATAKELGLLLRLLDLLDELLEVGKISLLQLAATRPFYSVLHCLSDLLLQLDIRFLTSDLISRICTINYAITSLVSPVVSHASPEGHVPLGPNLSIEKVFFSSADLESVTDSNFQLISRIPEYMVVCCWRSIKEASLILGQIAQMVLTRDDWSNFLSTDQVVEIGQYFKKQLLESRHRGAFELTSVGFNSFCDALWSNASPEIQNLPLVWLEEVLTELKEPEANLCATRRSAGLPYFLQALITSEKRSGRPQLITLSTVMKSLVSIASENTMKCASDEPQELIHSLNIMRVLFRDATLRDDVQQYISHGLRCAILGFDSPSWSVRNSSTMLFSALMQRIFGVNRSKHLTSRKNCISSRVFFSRYTGIYELLFEQLQAESKNVQSLHTRMYPILLILSRLLPPAPESYDASLNLDAFIPSVMKCGFSSSRHIRLLAARALTSLVCKNRIIETCIFLINSLPTNAGNQTHNSLHGTLLQIHYLLLEIIYISFEQNAVSHLADCLFDFVWLLTESMPCLVISVEYLAIMVTLLPWIDSNSSKLRLVCSAMMSRISSVSRMEPGYSDLLKSASQLIVTLTTRSDYDLKSILMPCLLDYLTSPHLDQRLRMLEKLATLSANSIPRPVCEVLQLPNIGLVIMKENDGECLSLWFEMLSANLDLSVVVSERTFDSELTVTILDTVLEKLEQFHQEDVLANGVYLVACLIGRCCESGRTVQARLVPSLRLGISRVSRACRFDQKASLRLAAVRGLHRLKHVMLDGFSSIGGTVFLLWECWIASLCDDDEEVQKAAAFFLKSFEASGDVQMSSAVLPHALRLLLGTFSDANCCALVRQFIQWIYHGLATQEDPLNLNDIRLFDRSEMNICRDDIVLVDVLTKELSGGLGPRPKSCCRRTLAHALATCLTNHDDASGSVVGSTSFLWDPHPFTENLVQNYRLRACLELGQKLLTDLPIPYFGYFNRI